jgi:hypothetical protein
MKLRPLKYLILIVALIGVGGIDLLGTASRSAYAAEDNRWFQIEVSIFSNESQIDRNDEDWRASQLELSFPEPMRRLKLLDSLFLIEFLDENAALIDADQPGSDIAMPPALTPAQERLQATGPQPIKATGDFKFYDFEREPYVQLTPAQSDFQGTNRALERTSANRLLFHGLWRQPVVAEDDATSLLIEGGLDYNGRHELLGSIAIRFNDNADRVVIDANLWLTEFSAVERPDSDWQLPALPELLISDEAPTEDAATGPNYFINRIYQMQQSRDMRSNEFHYLDHPAIGLVVIVQPYDPPPLLQP